MTSRDRLYDLLPALYRARDAEHDGALRALLAIIDDEFTAVERDIDQLYDNWFIETCEPWVVPYIGDLLGVTPIQPIGETTVNLRGYVANTLGYRRRKGTVAVLEQLARDVTGWPARGVEFFQRLATTQYMNHIRPESLATVQLKDSAGLAHVHGPFETATHTADVRSIARGRGRYNIPNVGLFLWRLQSYPLERVDARPVADPADGRYRVSPLGRDMALFNTPKAEERLTDLAAEINVPGRLRRRALYDELTARRAALALGETPANVFFDTQPVLRIHLNGDPEPLAPEEITICNLEDPAQPHPDGWRRPPAQIGGQTIRAGIDPELGRVALPVGAPVPSSVQVSYAYGFSADVGGGPYNRSHTGAAMIDDGTNELVTFQIGVTKDAGTSAAPSGGQTIVATLAEAVAAWNALPAGETGLIVIMDGRTYEESLTGAPDPGDPTKPARIHIKEGSTLYLVAGEWPLHKDDALPGVFHRRLGEVRLDTHRPHLKGDISIKGTAGADATPGRLALGGLLIEGAVTVLNGRLGGLTLSHATVAPGFGRVEVKGSTTGGDNSDLVLELVRSISGPLRLTGTVPRLIVRESILDGAGDPAVEAPGSHAVLNDVTALGALSVRGVEASDCLFRDPLVAERRQLGCVRFSHVPEGSRAPRQYRCQPSLALRGVDDPAEEARIRAALAPAFTSGDYGDPGYAQLSPSTAPEITSGAEDGAEMGAFRHLRQPQRLGNLATVLDEYLRVGLEAGHIFVT